MLSPYHPLQLTWGLIVWSVYFVVMYSGLSVACSVAPPEGEQGPFTWLNLGLLLLTLVTAAWLFYQAYRCQRLSAQAQPAPSGEFERRDAGAGQLEHFRGFVAPLAVGMNLIAGVATLVVGAPAAMLAPCV